MFGKRSGRIGGEEIVITDMKRDCANSVGWKFIDHDKTNMVYEWIDELLARIREGEIIELSVTYIDNHICVWGGMLKIEEVVLSGAGFEHILRPDLLQKKVICATYTIPKSLFPRKEPMLWRITLYI